MNKRILAIVEIDENVTHELAEGCSAGEYFEREFGWLEESGIVLKGWLNTDFSYNEIEKLIYLGKDK